jgi:hypothetical protein
MILASSLSEYLEDLNRAYGSLSSELSAGTPLHDVESEIREMIRSYLSDACSFREKNDIVNCYASLTYIHGWLDAGMYLGYYTGTTPRLFLPLNDRESGFDPEPLIEKTGRYARMLGTAVISVEVGPEFGSPLFRAAVSILDRTKKTCSDHRLIQSLSYSEKLGRYSYEYGWLDTGLRAGLFRIIANPELFTTETIRRL